MRAKVMKIGIMKKKVMNRPSAIMYSKLTLFSVVVVVVVVVKIRRSIDTPSSINATINGITLNLLCTIFN